MMLLESSGIQKNVMKGAAEFNNNVCVQISFQEYFLSSCTCTSAHLFTLETAGALIGRLFSSIRRTHLLPFSFVQ